MSILGCLVSLMNAKCYYGNLNMLTDALLNNASIWLFSMALRLLSNCYNMLEFSLVEVSTNLLISSALNSLIEASSIYTYSINSRIDAANLPISC